MSKELPYVYPANYYYQGLRKDLIYEGVEFETKVNAEIKYSYRFEVCWDTGETTEVRPTAMPFGNLIRNEDYVIGENNVVYPESNGEIILNKKCAIGLIKNLGKVLRKKPQVVRVFRIKNREVYRIYKFSKGIGYRIQSESLNQGLTIEEIYAQSNTMLKDMKYSGEVIDDLSVESRIGKTLILEEKLEEELLYTLTKEFLEPQIKKVEVIKEVIKEVEVDREVYPKSYYLYKHYYLQEDGTENVFYIGKGTGDAKGLASRIYNTTRNRYWDEIVEKHQGKIKCEVIEFFENEIECLNREKELQDYYWELGQCRGCADMHQRKKGLRFNVAG